jgi:hypothetical protein
MTIITRRSFAIGFALLPALHFTAAVMGQVALGLPCVIGGGATSAAMCYVNQ